MTEDLLTRGVANVYPSREALAEVLKSGKKLRIYFGIDPTGPGLHLGHAVVLWKLREFQDAGHHAILLIGDFTAMIGDPTDKSAARMQLSAEQVKENSKNYLAQAWKILDKGQTEVRYNSEWLAKLSLAELLQLASKMTYAQAIKREMFQKRLAENKDLFLHEFLYPLMQGYDSVALDVDLEIGGNDQIFNMLVGRDLLKKLKNKEKFVLATKLLTDATGVKMGKTEGNMVALADFPSDAYGKMMSWPDNLLPTGFELLTRLGDSEIKEILAGHPKDAKMRLAREIVSLYHGATAARKAETEFVDIFQKGEEPEVWEMVVGKTGEKLSEILARAGVVKSKSDFHRLVSEGAVNLWPDKNLTDSNQIFTATLKLKIGKKRFVRIILA